MPRRRGPKAQASVTQERWARWRYLLRHPEFRAELEEVLRLHHEPERGAPFDVAGLKLSQLVKRWGLTWIPSDVLYPRLTAPGRSLPRTFPPLNSDNIAFYEHLFETDMLPIDHPVGKLYSRDEEQDWRNLASGRITLELDVNYPIDVLLAEVEAQIRQEIELRGLLLKPARRTTKRRRPEKADLYLSVFDAAERGETFASIAKSLGKRPSTVKSIYLAACRNVFGLAAPSSKRALPLVDFDPETHMQQCPTCRAAQTVEQFCGQARRYAMQDQRSQRETTGFDETRGTGSSPYGEE